MIDARVFASPQAAAHACAETIRDLAARAIEERGAARVAVSGGSTPRLMFEALRGMDLDWRRIDWFWVDERCVPPDQELSNYGMTMRHLLKPARVPAARIHRVRGELPPKDAARAYLDEMERVFGAGIPEFDVVQLGLGADAHTASLFPGQRLVESRNGVAAAVYVRKMRQWRVTLLPAVLFMARARLALVTGADKVEALRRIAADPLDPRQAPGQLLLAPGAAAEFYLDEAAAAGLNAG